MVSSADVDEHPYREPAHRARWTEADLALGLRVPVGAPGPVRLLINGIGYALNLEAVRPAAAAGGGAAPGSPTVTSRLWGDDEPALLGWPITHQFAQPVFFADCRILAQFRACYAPVLYRLRGGERLLLVAPTLPGDSELDRDEYDFAYRVLELDAPGMPPPPADAVDDFEQDIQTCVDERLGGACPYEHEHRGGRLLRQQRRRQQHKRRQELLLRVRARRQRRRLAAAAAAEADGEEQDLETEQEPEMEQAQPRGEPGPGPESLFAMCLHELLGRARAPYVYDSDGRVMRTAALADRLLRGLEPVGGDLGERLSSAMFSQGFRMGTPEGLGMGFGFAVCDARTVWAVTPGAAEPSVVVRMSAQQDLWGGWDDCTYAEYRLPAAALAAEPPGSYRLVEPATLRLNPRQHSSRLTPGRMVAVLVKTLGGAAYLHVPPVRAPLRVL